MSSPSSGPSEPRVAAILVAHNGAAWLPRALAALASAARPALDVTAVNSGSSDATAAILARELPADRVVTLERNRGFAAAVTAALATDAVAQADLVLLVHDDLVLEDGAVARLVGALRGDATLGAVGPKLRSWGEARSLQEVGLSIDRLGRVESRLAPGELDQGQHDTQRDVLFVSTAGLLVRRELLVRLGGLDDRYPVFRDDLDLCWRIWLVGQRVAVVPAAVGHHVAAGSRRLRPVGRGKRWEARYFTERHTIATLLKNYAAARLLWVLPLLLAVEAGKVAGFVVTRRLGDALATLRALLWNVVQLPETLRRRRAVQRARAVPDADLQALFAPGVPRLRSYAEAMGSWLAGGGTRALMEDPAARPGREPRSLPERPVVVVGVLLLAAYLVGVAGLLGPGQLVGGEVAPWPAAQAFLQAYASPWGAEPLASASFSSPFQAVLGLASLLGFGSSWVAQRLVVLGLLPLAWLLAVRAGRTLTSRPGPRVVGATLYVISPVLLAALGEGRLGVLVVAALLPGLVLVAVRTLETRAGTAPGAWRAAGLLSLGLAVAAAAAPSLIPLLGALWALLLLVALARLRRGGVAAVRVTVSAVLAVLLLSPWLLELAGGGWASVAGPASAGALPLWRALALAPSVPPSLVGAGAAVATSVTTVAGALVLGLRSRPGAVAALLAGWAASSLAAWAVAASSVEHVWAPALLLPALLARAALGVVVAWLLLDVLARSRAGVRQLAGAVLAAVLLLGVLGGVLRLGEGPAGGLRRDPALLPAFVGAEPERVGPYRVVLLEEDEGVVRWDVTDAGGPSMLGFGGVPDDGLERFLQEAVGTVVGGVDPSAGARLGVANVRYLIVAEDAAPPELIAAINRQPALEPLPAGAVSVWQVRSWLPRAAVLGDARADALLATGDPGDTEAIEERGLARTAPDRYSGALPAGSELVVLSEGADAPWAAYAGDGRRLEPVDLGAVRGFRVGPGDEAVTLRLAGGAVHRLLVAWQVVLLLGIASLLLRPPGSRQHRTPPVEQLAGSLTAGPELKPAPGSVAPRPLGQRAPVDPGPAGGPR